MDEDTATPRRRLLLECMCCAGPNTKKLLKPCCRTRKLLGNKPDFPSSYCRTNGEVLRVV